MPTSELQAKSRALPAIQTPITVIMLFQVSALIIRSFAEIKFLQTGLDDSTAKILSALLGFIVLGILMLPVMVNNWAFVSSQFGRPASWTRMILACIALGVFIWLGQWLALLGLIPFRWDEPSLLTRAPYPIFSVACKDPLNLMSAIAIVAIVTPFFEEVINRGLIFQALLQNGEKLAAFGSAFLFAILHPPEAMPFAFVFGLIAAFQLLRYQTLWAVMITHGAINVMVELDRNCFQGRWLPKNIHSSITATYPLIVVSFIVCAVFAWWLAARYSAGAVAIKNRPDTG